MSVHDARMALNVFRGVNLAMADPKHHGTKRGLRDLQREARGPAAMKASAPAYKPKSEEERRAAMASFGGVIDG